MSLENSTIPVVSSSPERHTFQAQSYLNRCAETGEQPNEAYLDMYESARQQDIDRIADPDWQKNNLEYDLRSTEWILEKVRSNDSYAQNLYAAMCNMQWRSKELWPTLKEQNWSCSWRYAGGIVADMLGKGDYIDWYCSGIRQGDFDKEAEAEFDRKNYVSESVVTDEIAKDLDKLGWIPVPFEDE